MVKRNHSDDETNWLLALVEKLELRELLIHAVETTFQRFL
jgi:hypothetical protein